MPVTLAMPRAGASNPTLATTSAVAGEMNDTPVASETAISGNGVSANPSSRPSVIAASIVSRWSASTPGRITIWLGSPADLALRRRSYSVASPPVMAASAAAAAAGSATASRSAVRPSA